VSVNEPIRLTVVTVCYNDKINVQKTCASIKNQIIPNASLVEHLLVDGKSSDGTIEWYKENPPIQNNAFSSEPDRGIYHAMNKAIDAAQGTFIQYLNAGDVYATEESLATLLKQLNKPDVAFTYGRARVVDEHGRQVRNSVGMNPYSRRKHLFGLATVSHQATAMRSQLLRDLNGFDERFGTAADYHLLIRAGLVVRPAPFSEEIVDYATGGVSDVNVHRALLARHKARVDAMQWNLALNRIDYLYCRIQSVVIVLRKMTKKFLRKLNVRKFAGHMVA
jgi:glycosyltransferase involved in cell wall biosynthesis